MEPEPEPEPEPVAEPEPAAEPELSPEPEPVVSPQAEDVHGEESQTAVEDEAPGDEEAHPVPLSHPHIKLTVTYDPYADIEKDLAETERNLSEAVLESVRSEPAPVTTSQQKVVAHEEEPTSTPEPAPQPAPTPAPEPTYELLSPAEEAPVEPVPVLVGLPRDFTAEVYLPDEPLSLLYQLLPPNESPTDVLAKDWQVALSTRGYAGTRSRVSFPLRISHGDGTPVQATIRRFGKPIAGKHWRLAAIDGSDGTSPLAQEIGLEGLPETETVAERLLARSVDVGPWEAALAALAGLAAPEPWDLPGREGQRDVLRIYFASTFRAALEQDLLSKMEDGTFGAFCTGLLTPLAEPVYACLEEQGGDVPWRLAGFSTTGEGELGKRLASLPALPAAPRYLTGFGDLFIHPNATVDVPRRVAACIGEDADELVAAAIRRCAADYRLVAPAVDLASGDLRLLLPLPPTGGSPEALSVARTDGALVASDLLDANRAYVSARIVSRGLPAWLSPSDPTADDVRPAAPSV